MNHGRGPRDRYCVRQDVLPSWERHRERRVEGSKPGMSLSLQLHGAAPIVADVEVEDQSTKTKRPMRLELNAASISLTPTNGGEKLAWPMDIVQRPNPGGGGPFGKGLTDPFYISVAVNVNGFQDDPAQMTLYLPWLIPPPQYTGSKS